MASFQYLKARPKPRMGFVSTWENPLCEQVERMVTATWVSPVCRLVDRTADYAFDATHVCVNQVVTTVEWAHNPADYVCLEELPVFYIQVESGQDVNGHFIRISQEPMGQASLDTEVQVSGTMSCYIDGLREDIQWTLYHGGQDSSVRYNARTVGYWAGASVTNKQFEATGFAPALNAEVVGSPFPQTRYRLGVTYKY